MKTAALKEAIEANLRNVREGVDNSLRRAGRQGEEVTIVAVSKVMPAETVAAAVEAGVRDIGENKVQEAAKKIPDVLRRLGGGTEAAGKIPGVLGRLKPGASLPRWHLVGHLQSNKAKLAAGLFDIVQSVDSIKIAQELSRRAGDAGRKIDILIEVNTSGEATKSGAAPDSVAGLVSEISALESVSVRGLMTIGPLGGNEGRTRESFRTLRGLRDKIDGMRIPGVQMKYLSMGMSGDFEIAIEEGSNMVRIGTAIFGPRS